MLTMLSRSVRAKVRQREVMEQGVVEEGAVVWYGYLKRGLVWVQK